MNQKVRIPFSCWLNMLPETVNKVLGFGIENLYPIVYFKINYLYLIIQYNYIRGDINYFPGLNLPLLKRSISPVSFCKMRESNES